MAMQFQKALTLVVTNFSQKISPINSPPFPSGGCEWYVRVYPKGNGDDDYLSLFLCPAEPKSLGLNWKRKANFYFVLRNQSGKELHRTPKTGELLFCADSLNRGFQKTLPIKKALEKSFLENDRVTIELYIKVVEVVDGYHMFPASYITNKFLRSCLEYSDKSENETVEVNGFHVLSSQVTLVKQIFAEHPDIAIDFRSKNQVVKTEYMNVLLNLIETVRKAPQSLSEAELSNAHNELNELMEVGFKLEWLKTKLEEVTLERKKANDDSFRIQQLEEHVKTLEMSVSDLRVELEKEKAKSDIAAADDGKVLLLEQTVSDLKVELDKEKAKSATAAAKVFLLRQTLSDLRVEMDKKKENSAVTAKVSSVEDEDDDLFSNTKCLGIQQRRDGYKKLN